MSEIKALDKLRDLRVCIDIPMLKDRLCAETNTHNVISALESIADEIEAEIAECYMPLPCDADGVPIRVGDKIQQLNHAGVWTDAMPVIAVDENGCFALAHGLACEARTYVWGNNCRHVKPPTLEDVLRDYYFTAKEQCDGNYGDLHSELIPRYADEIRAMFEE